jgi:hypothetical protein
MKLLPALTGSDNHYDLKAKDSLTGGCSSKQIFDYYKSEAKKYADSPRVRAVLDQCAKRYGHG